MKCNGTIVEIGALDGFILIETYPNNFQKLLANRLHSQIYNTAVCRRRQNDIGFIVSDAVGDVENKMTKKHKKGWNKDTSEKIASNCTQLHHILKDVQHIDLFILNIESDEVEVLVTMDWNLEVDYWIIEIDNTNSEKERAVSDLLMSQGYVPTLSRRNVGKHVFVLAPVMCFEVFVLTSVMCFEVFILAPVMCFEVFY